VTQKKVLITGSNGLLGQKLVHLLSNTPSIHLIATSRGANRLAWSDSYSYRSLDITNAKAVVELLIKENPDVVIHTAAMTNVDQCEGEKEACWALNVTATGYLIEACRQIGCFFLHLSTDFIFDGKNGPYTEEAEPNPISFYGWSKFAAERLFKNSGLQWAIARTVLVYGIAHDMSRSNIILWVKKSLEEGKAIKVVTDQWRTPTLAEDLATGCLLIAQQEAEGIFNLSGKDFLTPYEMAIKTADYFQLDKSLISPVDANTFSQPALRPPRTGFILDKPRNVLGYDPHTFEEGIRILARQMNV
jgi:dTDP-4-dehydrorhamnose reductase